MEEYEYPVMHCPKCGKGQHDMDGFGFIACLPDGCGYCTHPSSDQGADGHTYCGICGDRTSLRRLPSHKGEMK